MKSEDELHNYAKSLLYAFVQKPKVENYIKYMLDKELCHLGFLRDLYHMDSAQTDNKKKW